MKNLTGAAGTVNSVQFVLDDDVVVAMLIDKTALDSGKSDDFYGVVNQVTEMDKKVLKLEGFADGKAKTLTTVKNFTPVLGTVNTDRTANLFKYSPDASGNVKSLSNVAATGAATVTAITLSNTVFTDSADNVFEAASDAVVYKYNATDKKYTVAKLSDIKKGAVIMLALDTDTGDDVDKVIDIIIFSN